MHQLPRVVVTRRLPTLVERRLADLFEVELNTDDHPFTADELRGAMARADGVLCTVTDRIDRAVLSVEPMRAKILANFGVGYNHIDMNQAKARGLAVTNTPGVLTEATADLAMALILMTARRLGEGERLVRRGEWTGWGPTHLMGSDVSGRTLGIIGLGRIGRAVARRAAMGFGMEVLGFTPRPLAPADAASLGVRQVTLEEVFQNSDFVSLHAPATPATRHLVHRERLALMKRTAVLINTARGDLVDETALAEALRSRTIAAAGLDVYEREPDVPRSLLELENVVLLPHLGSATESTRTAMGMRAVDNLAAFFRGEQVRDGVLDVRRET
jgi:lactate dehydrogenase-like 2-hydroxyacid dehydrogenase